jgi:hypothetical protein
MTDVIIMLLVVAFAVVCWRVHVVSLRADERRARRASQDRHPSTHVRVLRDE